MVPSSNDERIRLHRAFLRYDHDQEANELSDQQRKVPQPPLVKKPTGNPTLELPRDFRASIRETDILSIINHWESHRVYTEEKMTLTDLSFLLWSTQGVKSVRGNQYATLRTVPSGGARHPFETYLAVRRVEGLTAGLYHYLPMEHRLEWLGTALNLEERLSSALDGQRWAASANVVFFWSVIPYRSEWRYSRFAHRILLVDIGHVCQNLYIACEAARLGTCAIGAFERRLCDELFGLDGDEEFTLLAAPVGTVSAANRAQETEFYAFLKPLESQTAGE
jgi:SagB-type dehydrogenase family enzyme